MHLSYEIKIALLHYFRFSRSYPIIATEVNYSSGYLADIMVTDYQKIIEVEVKCTKNDLLEDFNKKIWDSSKHSLLESGKQSMPNLFYFCVPTELEEFAKKTILEKNNKYGLIQYTPNYSPDQHCISMSKSADYLHKEYNKNLELKIIKRMSSELANLYMDYYLKDKKCHIHVG